jgi:hypothetical protein
MLDVTDQRLDACSTIAEALLDLWTGHALLALDVGWTMQSTFDTAID